MKKALITGITGQDGSYLAEFLIAKGYQVHGIVRRASTRNTDRINHLYQNIENEKSILCLHYGDLNDTGSINKIISSVCPNEIYNLAAQSHVKVSFSIPEYTSNTIALGTLRILDAMLRFVPNAKFYQASSSEMFGASNAPQNENTTFHPKSPYAIAKLYAYWMTVHYRQAYKVFACNGILFNHESPRRGETFVTKKITNAIANILSNKQKTLCIGNLEAKRDWGFAPEYVEVMWNMLQQEKPEDFVVGTGESHTVREFIEEAFTYVGINIFWLGTGINEVGIIDNLNDHCKHLNLKKGDVIIKVDPACFRETDVDNLKADITKANKKLNWSPKITFLQLVQIMIDYDMKTIGLTPIGRGIKECKKFVYSDFQQQIYKSNNELNL